MKTDSLRFVNGSSARIAALLVSSLLLGACSGGGGAAARLDGRLLISLEDADAGSAASEGGSDHLTTIRLPLPSVGREDDAQVDFEQFNVESSRGSGGAAMALGGDGSWCVTVGPDTGDDGSAQARITVLDLQDLGAIRDSAALPSPAAGASVATHPFDPLVAVLLPQSREVIFIEIDADGLGEMVQTSLSGLIPDDAAPSSIAWHPGGRFIGVTLTESDQAAFFDTMPNGEGPRELGAWGDPVGTGIAPMMGFFAPDG
ncbi:MAG: hypothetical protein VYC34_10290, partial [Planctomycetota bacterium]|nr:hypothetical protein [Planctomycetota bacterium]